jgi:LuxR family maltose regulon positive regulatory protein
VTSAGAAPLVLTKLTIPTLPRQVICRPRLHQLLDEGTDRKLTLVVAPAGFGKTVLVTDWLLSAPARRVGWVSLAKSDNEPAGFWSYVRAALAGAGVQLPSDGDGLADRSGTVPPERVLAPLVNALAELTADVTLVLDDYHLITDSRIHRDIAFLIDHQPQRFHLLVLSRSSPPFLLARWKANGAVIQVQTRDLAFTAEEMTDFLDGQGVTLPPGLREPLFARLEGWAAALRLATLWISGRDDPGAAIAEFAASDATITDYLTTEVLGPLSARLRRFLLQTSILPRLTGPLCDAVAAAEGGAHALAELNRRGLFVEAVTPSRDCFRYHQLFAELLRLELQRAYPGMVAELHLRAAKWFAANGFAADAIDHGLVAGDWASVRTLMLGETLAIGSSYPPSVIEGWLSSLPRRVLDTSPFFLVLHAFVLAHTGRLGKARRALHRAQNLARLPGIDPELPELGALQYAVAAGIARLDCDLAAARQSAHALGRVCADEAALIRMARAAAANAVAATTFWHGDIGGAEQLLRETERETAAHQLMRMRANCLSATALLLASTGRLREAEALAASAQQLARSVGVAVLFQTSPALLASAVLSVQRADHLRARQQLATVYERARHHKDRAPLLAAGVLLARLSALGGDIGEAFTILDEAKAASPGWQPPAALQAMIAEDEARICLLAGDIAAARAVHSHLTALSDTALSGQIPAVTMARQATQARILLAQGHSAAASALFSLAASAALGYGQLSRAVEAHVGAAVASRSAGQPTVALACLKRALALAQDETIMAPFIWEATSMRPLLLQMEHGPHPALGFRQRLLTVMGIPARSRPGRPGRTPAAQTLSDRELTVLRLLEGNLTNPEIAAALSVSPNTLKTHVKHIYHKLGVNSRQQAVIRSRALDLQ